MKKLCTVAIKNFISRHITSTRTFALSFATVILIGAFLLYCPFSASKHQLSFVNALFTSASAVCVTGLTVIDIGKDLSTTGQIITMFLFQIGGLGIITFSLFFFGLMGRNISFKGRYIVQSTFLHTPQRNFYFILKSVLLTTVIIESIGILLLFIRFSKDFPVGKAFYHALYNAVSAFNNCGYSLFSDNLTGYQTDLVVNLTVMGLIVLGGIGFIVHHEIILKLTDHRKKLSIHTKIVIFTTSILILVGAVLFYFFEYQNTIREFPLETKILVSLFQSITSRTAGFNTVDIGHLTNNTILIFSILMFIGASPGSTGGGIKTTSAALLFLIIWNRFKGNEEVNIFNRTVPREILTRTISIIFASAFSIVLFTTMLLFAGEGDKIAMESRHFFIEYLFEAISAFGTVGLSMGITSHLNDLQKILITILMFAGRVGLLTLALSLTLSSRKKSIIYAEESVMVG